MAPLVWMFRAKALTGRAAFATPFPIDRVVDPPHRHEHGIDLEQIDSNWCLPDDEIHRRLAHTFARRETSSLSRLCGHRPLWADRAIQVDDTVTSVRRNWRSGGQ